MAATSPALTNNNNTTTTTATNMAHRTDTPPKTLRGLNKPKCQICGNVARSRSILFFSQFVPPHLRSFQNPRILCYRCCFLGLRLDWTLIRFCLCLLFGMFNWLLETGFSLLQAFLFFLLFFWNKIRADTIFFSLLAMDLAVLISHKFVIFHKCMASWKW